jgi:hypothetical protein
VVEWVDTPKDKLISCSFLKPNTGTKQEMEFSFDVSKYDKLFDVFVRGGVIRLVEGHAIPIAEQLARRKFANGMVHTPILLTNVITYIG